MLTSERTAAPRDKVSEAGVKAKLKPQVIHENLPITDD